MRRKNGSGTLYRRGEMWYAQIKVGGRLLRLSTGETNKKRATARLDAMARGFDLSDDERLAAVATALKPRHVAIEVGDAFESFAAAPCNRGKVFGNSTMSLWRIFTRWLHGGPKYGKRKETLPAYPSVKTIDEVTGEMATQFVSEIGAKYAPYTAKMAVQFLSRMWKVLNVEPNPWAALPPIHAQGHVRKAFTDEELRRILETAEGELKTLLTVGAYTGLRLGDAATLRWEQVTPEMDAIILQPHKTAHSSGRVVAIPIHDALKAAMGEHKGAGWVTPRMAALSRARRCTVVQAHFRRCGIETVADIKGYMRKAADYGFHSLRSTFITRLANAGMPLAQIQGLVGHVSAEMSMHYYRQDAEAARGILSKLPDYT